MYHALQITVIVNNCSVYIYMEFNNLAIVYMGIDIFMGIYIIQINSQDFFSKNLDNDRRISKRNIIKNETHIQ